MLLGEGRVVCVAIPLTRTCKRVVLRQLIESDLAQFQAYRSDSEVARYQDWEQMTDSEALSFIQHQKKDASLMPGYWCRIGIADRKNGILIGDIRILSFIDRETQEMTDVTVDSLGFVIDEIPDHREPSPIVDPTVQVRIKEIIARGDLRAC